MRARTGAAGLLLVVLGACGGGGEAATTSTTAKSGSTVTKPAGAGSTAPTGSTLPSGPTSSAAPASTTASTETPAPAPAPTPAPTAPATPPPGPTTPTSLPAPPYPLVPLSTAGARLIEIPAPGPSVSDPAGPALACAGLAHATWTVHSCQRVATEGGVPHAWIIETKGPGWRITLYGWSQGKGAWLADYEYLDESGVETAEIDARVHAMRSDSPFSELVVGFRVPGSGSYLLADIVEAFDGPTRGTLVGSIDLSHGSATFPTGSMTTWSAQYPGGEPNCCPAHFDRSKVFHASSGWVTQKQAQDPENPGSDLA